MRLDWYIWSGLSGVAVTALVTSTKLSHSRPYIVSETGTI